MAKLIEVYRAVIELIQLNPQENISFALARRIEQMEAATKAYDADVIELKATLGIPMKPDEAYVFPDEFTEEVKKLLEANCNTYVKPLKWKVLEKMQDVDRNAIRVPGSIIAGLMPIIEGGPEEGEPE